MSKRKKQPPEVHQLELENGKLKRTISRLRKKLARLEETQSESETEVEPEEEPKEVKELSNGSLCPSCNANGVVELLLLGKTYNVCKICKWRKKDV